MADDNVEKGEIESTKENFKHLKKNRVEKFMQQVDKIKLIFTYDLQFPIG